MMMEKVQKILQLQQESIPQPLISEMSVQQLSPVRNIKLISRFYANVERRLKLSGLSYRKNFDFTQTRRYNVKLHNLNRRKIRLPCFE